MRGLRGRRVREMMAEAKACRRRMEEMSYR